MLRAEKFMFFSTILILAFIFTSSTTESALSRNCYYCKGLKGDKGDHGSPGKCSSSGCASALPCSLDAQAMLKLAGVGNKGIPSSKSLRSVIGRGKALLKQVEEGTRSIKDLSEADSNNLYAYLFYNSTLCITTTASGIVVPDDIKGERGDPGPSGEDGIDGIPGERGEKGDTGMKGERGEKGDIGPKGDMGMMGDRGEPGPVGNTGVPGPVGPMGPEGINGNIGPQGSKGEKGTIGMSGVTYTNWGVNTCPSGVTLLYRGNAVQIHHSGVRVQCLRTQPQVNPHGVPIQHAKKLTTLRYTNRYKRSSFIPCALCYVPSRVAKFLNLGANSCPRDWTKEFEGSLGTGLSTEGLCINGKFLSNIRWTPFKSVNDLSMVESECYHYRSCKKGPIACALCTR